MRGRGERALFDASAVPAVEAANDSAALELGVRFRSDAPGQLKGRRFYKGAGNTGTHTGSLWSASGALLATATFTSGFPTDSYQASNSWVEVAFQSNDTTPPTAPTHVEAAPHSSTAIDLTWYGSVDGSGEVQGNARWRLVCRGSQLIAEPPGTTTFHRDTGLTPPTTWGLRSPPERPTNSGRPRWEGRSRKPKMKTG
ncbi:DUF4082 domain-containing protein [Corallococcus sp. EGB]|uniref:DUF4082 domain-containing protein n=1 Tax=Corallococcus sp. EGB TaxID=1521117 RepID=UPI00351CEDE9